jgi:TolB protein
MKMTRKRVVPVRSIGLTALVLAAAVAAGAMGPPAQSAFPGVNGRLAFTLSGGDAQIYTVRTDGTGLRRLSPRAMHDTVAPSWSADGRWVAFVARGAVWRMKSDGATVVRVTPKGMVDPETPGFSPGGGKVVFAARTARSNYDIYVSRLDGKGLKRLTRSPLIDEHPSWSPDGRRIAFTRAKAAPNIEVWIMNADGTHQRKLGLGGDPDWSPDGRSIAFARGLDLWVMRADGSRPVQITHGPGMSAEPEWSPDGRWIAFWNDRASGEATKGDIYVVRPDGSDLRRVTRAPSLWHFNPSWQPVKPR